MRERQATWVILFAATLAVSMAALVLYVRTLERDALGNDEICNPLADYFLGAEDYAEAVRLHRRVVTENPADALAHYHLGFAYGMLGRHAEELAEYRRAASLGLRKWDLFMNLGRLYLDEGDSQAAMGALRKSVELAPDRADAHFDLGLAYERLGMLTEAQAEMLASIRLAPSQADVRNMLGVICAEERNFECARRAWSDPVRTSPDFEPAHANLAILDRVTAPPGTGPKSGVPAFVTASSNPPSR
jgi:tetratricopeptide (TPR) repeat protein